MAQESGPRIFQPQLERVQQREHCLHAQLALAAAAPAPQHSLHLPTQESLMLLSLRSIVGKGSTKASAAYAVQMACNLPHWRGMHGGTDGTYHDREFLSDGASTQGRCGYVCRFSLASQASDLHLHAGACLVGAVRHHVLHHVWQQVQRQLHVKAAGADARLEQLQSGPCSPQDVRGVTGLPCPMARHWALLQKTPVQEKTHHLCFYRTRVCFMMSCKLGCRGPGRDTWTAVHKRLCSTDGGASEQHRTRWRRAS